MESKPRVAEALAQLGCVVDRIGAAPGGWDALVRDYDAACRELVAVTAERDRLLVTVERQGNANEGLGARIRELRAALAQAERDLSWTEPQRPRVKKARADMKAALWRDDHPGHTHPRPCSICRREDCTVLHACE